MLHANSFAASNTEDATACSKYSSTKVELNRIYDEYSSLPKKPESADKVFILWRQLNQAIKGIHALYPADYNHNQGQYELISSCLWHDKYQELGLSIGHYSDRLEYSEKLLTEAHQLNPHSKYRNYTFYTEIYGKGGEDYGFPDINKAASYLKEFPQGPYAIKVNEILAGFYHDLYAALLTIEKQPDIEKRSETYSCFDDYISQHPESANKERARKLGIQYFKNVIAETPLKDAKRSMYLEELNSLEHQKTDNIINVCGD